MLRIILFFAFHISTKSLFAQDFTLDSNSINTKFGFIENKGQIIDQNNRPNPEAQFLCNVSGLKVQIRRDGYSYEVIKEISRTSLPKRDALSDRGGLDQVKYGVHRVDIHFDGAKKDIQWEASESQNGYSNYYTTGTPEGGVLDVRSYNHLIARDVWTHIDVEFLASGDAKQPVKYNIIIRPGGDPKDVRLRVVGMNAASVSTAGGLLLQTAYGDLEESIPLSFVENEGNSGQENIAVRFRAIEKNVFGFQLPEGFISNGKTLVIDPTPDRVWGTWLGGNGADFGRVCKTDNSGNIYLSGETESTNNIATSGAHQTTLTGQSAFLVKFNANGVRQWGTYYGTSSTLGYSIAIDASANVFLSGDTGAFNSISTSSCLFLSNMSKAYLGL